MFMASGLKTWRSAVVACVAATSIGLSATAGASTVVLLTDTVTSPSTNNYTVTTAAGQDPSVYPSLDPTLAYTLSGNQFNGSGQIATPANFGAAAGSGGTWNFQDSYNFVISSSATAQSAVISIGSTLPAGLTDLEVRIINGATVSNTTPQLGVPTNGTVTGDTWTTWNFANGSYSFTMPAGLNGGSDYILQVRGDATVGQSSSYGGTLTFTPVPLPAGLPLLLSGIVGLGVMRRRRVVALACA